MLLSGRFDAFHLGFGIISCMTASYFTGKLLIPSTRLSSIVHTWFNFIIYIPWLLYQVLVANLHMMYLVFHPRMMDLIDPRIITIKSRMRSDMTLVTFANSITLTPGTITVFANELGDISVHVIDAHSGDALPGEMEERIAGLFGE